MIFASVNLFFILIFVNLIPIPMSENEIVATSTSSPQDTSPINWSICILCQQDTNEVLQSPGNTKRDDIDNGKGYQSLGDNISSFHELGCLPMPIDISKLDEGLCRTKQSGTRPVGTSLTT